MSFYARYNGFRGFGSESAATVALKEASTELQNQMLAAMTAVSVAEAAIPPATARVEAAKGPVAKLKKISSGVWWRGHWNNSMVGGQPAPAGDNELWARYLPGFTRDEHLWETTNGPFYNFDEPNQLVSDDLTVATAEKKEADAVLAAAEKSLVAAKAVLVKAQDAVVANRKKMDAAITADNKAVVTAAQEVEDKKDQRQQMIIEEEVKRKEKAAGMSPLFLLGGAAAVLGLFALMSRKGGSSPAPAPAAIAGYRRRKRR